MFFRLRNVIRFVKQVYHFLLKNWMMIKIEDNTSYLWYKPVLEPGFIANKHKMKISTKGKYYGTQDIKVSYNEIVMSQYDYTIETSPWHYHENPYFMFVLHGNMIDCNKKVKSLLPPGSLMFNNWQEGHYGVRHSNDAAGFHLEFEKSWFKKKRNRFKCI